MIFKAFKSQNIDRFAPLQKVRKIFTLVFLCGMLYTVFNYLPVIEEEVSSKKYEQTSKSEPEPDGSEPDEESESNQVDIFLNPVLSGDHLDHFPATYRHHLCTRYLPPLREHCTPPPRPQA